MRSEGILEEVSVPTGPVSMQAYMVSKGVVVSAFALGGTRSGGGRQFAWEKRWNCIREHSERVLGWLVVCPPLVYTGN